MNIVEFLRQNNAEELHIKSFKKLSRRNFFSALENSIFLQ